MSVKTFRQKLWFNIFVRVAAIFVAFIIILCLSNVTLLVNFFAAEEKKSLAEQLDRVSKLSLDSSKEIVETLSEINETYNFDVEIYNSRGSVLYTTHGGQMMDFFQQDNDRFNMSHEDMIPIETEDLGNGITFQTVVRRFDRSQLLLCKKEISDGIFAEVRIQQQFISNSAAIANKFIVIVSVICLFMSLIWVFIFAKKFSRPISQMNEITKDIAHLNFQRRIKASGNDEIGQLSVSINELSDSLCRALEDLKKKNKQLEYDIQAERRLDAMRKAFIANVSHELKTPIAIINGYAEGLKLDVKPESRNEYCDTIIDESNRMNKLVLSILELSKYESGQIPVNKQPVDISAMAQSVMKRIFSQKEIHWENNIPKNTLILADTMQIEQVLRALLENACAHTPADGRVWIESTGDRMIRISIFNTGSHIDDEQMPRIWESFYRGDTSHKRDSSHFGLGLSIVSAIIKMHGYRCGVYNTDEGVCFWFEAERQENAQ